jgi:hypothetical protein
MRALGLPYLQAQVQVGYHAWTNVRIQRSDPGAGHPERDQVWLLADRFRVLRALGLQHLERRRFCSQGRAGDSRAGVSVVREGRLRLCWHMDAEQRMRCLVRVEGVFQDRRFGASLLFRTPRSGSLEPAPLGTIETASEVTSPLRCGRSARRIAKLKYTRYHAWTNSE